MDFLEILSNFINQHAVPFILHLISAAVILIVGFAIAKLIIKKIRRCAFFEKLDSNIQSLIANTIKIILYTVIIIIAVEIVGVPGSTIIAILGSCGLAIGLALQGGLSNIAGGVIIMLFKPFHVGDYVTSDLGSGTVTDIGIFYTKLITPDNIAVSVPNSALSNSAISNYSVKETRRVDITVSIAFEADIDLAKKVLLASAETHDLVLKDPAPVVYVTEQADSAIKLQLRTWVNNSDYWAVKFDLTEDSKKALDKFSISIPYAQLDVHVKND
ncbi:MAG: mechanosensitive ion channel [Clostridia bacterium]|nr:mechanosensitive ion channel [Clostridia bacterium]